MLNIIRAEYSHFFLWFLNLCLKIAFCHNTSMAFYSRYFKCLFCLGPLSTWNPFLKRNDWDSDFSFSFLFDKEFGLALILSYFSCCCDKILRQKQPKKEKVCLVHQGTAHHGTEVKTPGAWRCWSQYREVNSYECMHVGICISFPTLR